MQVNRKDNLYTETMSLPSDRSLTRNSTNRRVSKSYVTLSSSDLNEEGDAFFFANNEDSQISKRRTQSYINKIQNRTADQFYLSHTSIPEEEGKHC